ncbi:hypothetical protein DFH11DRAFT_1188616 [Phellopilus nigrolimitatus]|nr:hypothetical protein DFH11DRAFT_1188616 [Phellopilus nigrolimitatus]
MTSTKLHTPPLPFEISEKIIQLYLGGPYTFPDSHRPSDLASLLLVCKAWHEYGELQLYRSISISENSEESEDREDSEDSEDSKDSEDNEATGLMLLSATLSQNSRLANLVRFFAFESKCFGVEHVRAITEIISLSSNLTHLSVSRLCEDWQKTDTQLVDSLVDMSALRFRFEFPPETPARCLALRRIEVQGLDIACFFAKMAPFVEDVEIVHDKFVYMDNRTCLNTWSETLTRLRLYMVEGNWKEIRHFPSGLRKLRYFRCEATDMHPKLLESMDSLEELFYYVDPERAEQLVKCFREGTGSGDFLPALKVLHFRSTVLLLDPKLEFSQNDYDDWVEPSRAAFKSLEEICARRNISFSVDDSDGYPE